jgi:hypothetical protein
MDGPNNVDRFTSICKFMEYFCVLIPDLEPLIYDFKPPFVFPIEKDFPSGRF